MTKNATGKAPDKIGKCVNVGTEDYPQYVDPAAVIGIECRDQATCLHLSGGTAINIPLPGDQVADKLGGK